MVKPVLAAALVAVCVHFSAARAGEPAEGHSSITLQSAAPSGAEARKLLGRNVRNMRGEVLGEIKSIHLDRNDRTDTLIVAVGGLLGVGVRELPVDWRDLRIDAPGIESGSEPIRVDMTKEQLKAKRPYIYTDPALRGTVFNDEGAWTPGGAELAAAPPRPTGNSTGNFTGDFNLTGHMSAHALFGKVVKNAAHESVGKIDDVYLDAAGNVKLVVVSVGGFLGMGSKAIAVPWSDLKISREGNSIAVLTSWTKDQLKAMPDYKDERRAPAGASSGK